MNTEDIRKILEQLNEQLKIANKLKAWELKLKHKELGMPVHPTNAEQIDAIMDGE
jgi:hypothetical protein